MISNNPNTLNEVSSQEDLRNNSGIIFKRLTPSDVNYHSYYVEKENIISQEHPVNEYEIIFSDTSQYYILPQVTSSDGYIEFYFCPMTNQGNEKRIILQMGQEQLYNCFNLYFNGFTSELNVSGYDGAYTEFTLSGYTLSSLIDYYKIKITLNIDDSISFYVNDVEIDSYAGDNFILANMRLFYFSYDNLNAVLFGLENDAKIKNVTGFWNLSTPYQNLLKTIKSYDGDIAMLIDNTSDDSSSSSITAGNTGYVSSINVLSYNNWTSLSSTYKNTIFTDLTDNIIHYQNYLQKYLQSNELTECLSSSYLYSIEIYKRNFGDFIKEISSLTLNNTISLSSSLTEYLSNNRFIKMYFDDSDYSAIGDMYSGVIYLFGSTSTDIHSYSANYTSSQLRKELTINCNIQPDEFNKSTNPTAYSSTAYTSYLDKIEFNEELTYNGGLEEGSTTGWNSNYCSLSVLALEDDNESYLTDYVYSGTHSLKVTLSNTSTTSCDIYQDINLEDFNLSLYEKIRGEWYINKGTLTANKTLTFSIEQYNGSSFTSTTSISISISSLPYNQWYRIVLFDQLQYTEQLRMKMNIDDNPKDSTYFFLDHMSLRLRSGSNNRNNIWITGLGLYDNYNNLLINAKLGKPLRKGLLPLNFKIKVDLL